MKEKEEKKEEIGDDLFIPGIVIEDDSIEKEVKKENNSEESVSYKVNVLTPDYIFLLFLSFYYNYSIDSFEIVSREESKVEYKILENH